MEVKFQNSRVKEGSLKNLLEFVKSSLKIFNFPKNYFALILCKNSTKIQIFGNKNPSLANKVERKKRNN